MFGAINSQPAVKSNASGPAVLAGGRTGGSESFARCESQAWQKEGLGNIWMSQRSVGWGAFLNAAIRVLILIAGRRGHFDHVLGKSNQAPQAFQVQACPTISRHPFETGASPGYPSIAPAVVGRLQRMLIAWRHLAGVRTAFVGQCASHTKEMTWNARSSNRWTGSTCARLWWFCIAVRMIRGCFVAVTRPDAFDLTVWIK